MRDKTRKPGKTPLPAETIAKVLVLPCTEPPGNATHWTGRAVAKAVDRVIREMLIPMGGCGYGWGQFC